MKRRGMKQVVSMLLALVMVLSLLPATAFAAIPPETKAGKNGKLQFALDSMGVLTWSGADGATSYDLTIRHNGELFQSEDDYTSSSYDLLIALNSYRKDSGTVEVNVLPNGVDGYADSTTFMYSSPYPKLANPTNLTWDGNVADWDDVPYADSYVIYLYQSSGGGYNHWDTTTSGFNFDAVANVSSLLSDGWFFKVQAKSAGAFRNSDFVESPRRGGVSFGGLILTSQSGNGNLTFALDNSGVLTWSGADGATSYDVTIWHDGELFQSEDDYTSSSYALYDMLNSFKKESGELRVAVSPNGISGCDGSASFTYLSPYPKLANPTNLYWDGNVAVWDDVPNADSYVIYLYQSSGGGYNHWEVPYSGFNFDAVANVSSLLSDGWFFSVQAKSTGDYRNSDFVDSPRRGGLQICHVGADTYNATTGEDYSGGKVKVETTAGKGDYESVGYGYYVEKNSTVKMYAQPDAGHRFVEWRMDSAEGTVYSTDAYVTFTPTADVYLVAVFENFFPAGAGTINNPAVCNSYAELKYALEHPTIQGVLVNSFTNSPYQTFYTLEKGTDFEAGHCAITIPANTTKYLTINTDINIRVPYVDYLLYSFIDNRGSLTVGGTGSLNVSMNARGYPSAIIYNNSALNIGGGITFDPTNQSFDSMHGYSVINAVGSTVINSGTLIGYATSAVLYMQGSMDIYGGTFKVKNGDEEAFGLNTDSYLTMESHNVNLYGGTFDGIRADQTIGADIVKLPDLLGYGAYYTYAADGSKFDPSGKKDTHETLTVKMNNIVGDIALTIDPPKQNGEPDQTVACGDYGYKQATGNDNMWDDVDVYWEESTDGNTWTKMASNATFTVGKHYRASINVMTRSGNIFDVDAQIEPNVVATVNGYYAEVFRYPEVDPSELICVRYDFGILNDNIIEQIDIDGVTEPVVGEYPSYDCAISGSGYTVNTAYDNGTYAINGMCWYDVTFDMWMKPDMTFQIGHEYKVFIDVKTEDGYEFYTTNVGGSYPPKGWGYINGNYATLGVQWDARNEQSLSWTFTCQPKTVKSVAISGLNVPMDGAKPDFTAVTDSDYYTVTDIQWQDYTSGTDMTAEDTFEEGHEYWLLLTVEPVEEDGEALCKFVDNKTVAYLNGVEVKNIPNDSWQEVTSSVKKVTIYYTFKVGAGGVAVSGKASSYLTGDVTIELLQGGTVKYTTTAATGENSAYSFSDVAAGTYTMRVSKTNHITREYEVVVGTEAVAKDVKICPKGDVNLDGEVNADDLTALARHVAKIEILEDSYALLCSDVDDNGTQSADDLTKLARYVAKIINTLD